MASAVSFACCGIASLSAAARKTSTSRGSTAKLRRGTPTGAGAIQAAKLPASPSISGRRHARGTSTTCRVSTERFDGPRSTSLYFGVLDLTFGRARGGLSGWPAGRRSCRSTAGLWREVDTSRLPGCPSRLTRSITDEGAIALLNVELGSTKVNRLTGSSLSASVLYCT